MISGSNPGCGQRSPKGLDGSVSNGGSFPRDKLPRT